MQVEEIALLNTTLMRPDGGRFLYPNIVMSTLGVVNIARSGPHNEAFSVSCTLRCAVDAGSQLVLGGISIVGVQGEQCTVTATS